MHPCLGQGGTESEVGPLEELELKPVKVARRIASIKGKVYRLESKEGGSTTAVFVPDAALKTDPVSFFVWIHGDLICGGEGPDAVSYVQNAALPIAEILANSKVRFRVLFLRGGPTAPEAERLRNKVTAAGIPNLEVRELVRDTDPETSDHCLMPVRHLRTLLDSTDSGA